MIESKQPSTTLTVMEALSLQTSFHLALLGCFFFWSLVQLKGFLEYFVIYVFCCD